MSKTADHKYRWLLNLLMNSKLTREEIAERWYKYSDGEPLSRRTFKNWKDAIELHYDTIIECDKKDGYRYYIDEDYKKTSRGTPSTTLFSNQWK